MPSVGDTDPDPARRYPLGWIVLILLLALMVSNQLASSLTPRPGASSAADRPDEDLLQLEVSTRRAADATVGSIAASLHQQDVELCKRLSQSAAKLAADAPNDIDAARSYGAILTELGRSVPSSATARLRGSRLSADRALAEVYGASRLGALDAARIERALTSDSFVYRLGGVQARMKAGDRGAFDRAFTGERFVAEVVESGGMATLLAGGMIAWTLYGRARRNGQLPPGGLPTAPASLADADRLALRAAQILAIFLLVSVAAQLLPKAVTRLTPGGAAAISGVAMLVVLTVLAKVPVAGRSISLATAGLSAAHIGRHVRWGIGGFFFEFPISVFLLMIGMAVFRFLPAPTHPVTEELADSHSFIQLLPLYFYGAVTAPIWEEFLFRGLLFPAFARLFGRLVPAALFSGLTFAMVHPQGLAAWLGLAAVGVAGCVLTYRTRSLVPTIVMHMLHNGVIFLAAFLEMAPA